MNSMTKVLRIGVAVIWASGVWAFGGQDRHTRLAASPAQQQTNAGSDVDAKPEPIRHRGTRVGRNDPCPCGSGKKYKNCCLRKGGGGMMA